MQAANARAGIERGGAKSNLLRLLSGKSVFVQRNYDQKMRKKSPFVSYWKSDMIFREKYKALILK